MRDPRDIYFAVIERSEKTPSEPVDVSDISFSSKGIRFVGTIGYLQPNYLGKYSGRIEDQRVDGQSVTIHLRAEPPVSRDQEASLISAVSNCLGEELRIWRNDSVDYAIRVGERKTLDTFHNGRKKLVKETLLRELHVLIDESSYLPKMPYQIPKKRGPIAKLFRRK